MCAWLGCRIWAHCSRSVSCPVFREELRMLRGRKWSSSNSTLEGGRLPMTSQYRRPGREGLTYCLIMSSTNGPKLCLVTGCFKEGRNSCVQPRWRRRGRSEVRRGTRLGGGGGSTRPDRRGIVDSEMVSRNDLIVLNRDREITFRRGVVGSIIDLPNATPRLASMIGD